MKKLKYLILRSFVVFFLGLALTVSLIEELFNEVGIPLLANEYKPMLAISSVAFEIAAVIFFSFLFYRSLDKEITKKSQEIAKQQNRLFANIAHDLKTPLTSITGFSKALFEDITDPDERKEVSSIIYQKSIAANDLLDLLFQYTKLNSPDFELKKQSMDIGLLLKETIADYYDLIEKYAIDLILDLSEQPMVCSIDKLEMKRVFANLIVNGCKHNPPQTSLLITMKETWGKITIVFADNGKPIPSVKREQLFQPFVSENEAERNFNSSGLGLAITKSIVEKHGFRIELIDGDQGYRKKFVITGIISEYGVQELR